MRPEIGWKVHDCYMGGRGELSDIGCEGIVEGVGKDWVIVRNQYRNTPIYVEILGPWEYYDEWEENKYDV